MAAMSEEVDTLLGDLRSRGSQTITIGERTFYSGQLYNNHVVIAFSRWGKVAAAVTATHLIDRFNISALWFSGVAGALDPSLRIGDIVIADRLIQHDLDASPLFPRFEIPLTQRSWLSTDTSERSILYEAASNTLSSSLGQPASDRLMALFGIHAPRVVVGSVATGDHFVADSAQARELRHLLPQCVCVEMEGAAVAQVCAEHAVPLAVLRIISDSANHDAHIDFPRFVSTIASAYTGAIITAALRIRALRS